MVTKLPVAPAPITDTELATFKPAAPSPGLVSLTEADVTGEKQGPINANALFDAAFKSLPQEQPKGPDPARDGALLDKVFQTLQVIPEPPSTTEKVMDYAGDTLGKMGRAAASGVTYDTTSGIYGAIENAAGVMSDVVGKPMDYVLHGLGGQGSIDPFAVVQEIAKSGQIATQSQSDINAEIVDEGADLPQKLLSSAARSIGQSGSGIVASVLTGNPAISLTQMGVVTGGQAMADARAKGMSNADSLRYGLIQGGVEVATEAMPVFNLIKDMKAGSSLFKTLADQAIAEVPGEQIATLLQGFTEYSAINDRNITFEQYLNQIPSDAAFTLGSTLLTVGMQTGGIYGINKLLGGKEEPVAPPAPPSTRDQLAEAMNGPTEGPKEQFGPFQPKPNAAPRTEQTPPPAAPAPSAPQEVNVGDVVEHVNRYGEVIKGTVDSVQDTNGERSISVFDDNGELHTIFESEGPVETLAKAPPPTPTRDDLAAALDPNQAPVVEKPAKFGPPTFKDALSTMTEDQLIGHYNSMNVRNRNLAEKELTERFPAWKTRSFTAMEADELANIYRDPARLMIERKAAQKELDSRFAGWNVTKAIDIEDAAAQVDTAPTDAQKEAGNYQKGHTTLFGLPITIENPKGSTRSGTDATGTKWEVQMPVHYGYIKRTEAADGDHLDIFIGDTLGSENVYVIDQIDADTGDFDEHKAFLGFQNMQEAVDAYGASFSDGRAENRIGQVTNMTLDEFKGWARSEDTKKPLAYEKPAPPPAAPEPEQPAEQQGPRQGVVGDKLAAGEVVLSTTGRALTPFPKIGMGSPRAATLTEKRVEEWLMQNALDEARARGDDFNALQFEANLKKPSQADKDSAEYYLFDPEFLTDRQTDQAPEPPARDNVEQDQQDNTETPPETAQPRAPEQSEQEPDNKEQSPPDQTDRGEDKKPKKPSKKEAAELRRKMFDLYYKVGRIVPAYGDTFDRVISYTYEPFSVQVVQVEKRGDEWVDVGHIRAHSTYPSQKNLEKVWNEEGAAVNESSTVEPETQPPATPEPEASTETQTAPETENSKPAERGKKLQDVGEKMEGKRAFQDRMDKAKPTEQAKEIIQSTKKAAVFNLEKRESQTDGVNAFAVELVDNFYDFSAYLKKRGILWRSGRGRYGTKYYGWEQQVAALFAPQEDEWESIVIGENVTIDPTLAERERVRIIAAANDFIELGSRVNDMLANSDNIDEFKVELKNGLQDQEFRSVFTSFSKSYSLEREIFSESSWSTFGRIKDDTEVKKSDRAKPMVRPKLENINRDGLKDYRNGRDITPEEFRTTFGFRGVEFGEWVNAKEGQLHVNHAFDALHDLAKHLGIKPSHISLGGKLGFAFGSRGSGEHAAHYEPDTNVINLTKTKGDGSVAHEWLHALDFNLRANDQASSRIMDMAYRTLEKKPKDSPYLEKYIKQFLKKEVWYERTKSSGPIANAKLFIEQVSRDPFRQLASTTQFKKEADALGKDYWGLGRELLARAWESYIHDTLEGKSPYLVNDWVAEGTVTKKAGYRGTPYPTGDERQEFNQFFDDFMKIVEFSDSGVKFKDGAELPIQRDVRKLVEEAQAYLPKLVDMMKEISDGDVQQNKVPASVSTGDGAAGPDTVSTIDAGEDDARAPERGDGSGAPAVRSDSGTPENQSRNEGRSEASSDGDRVRADDTVPSDVDIEADEEIPDFQAKGTNHVISVGALDEKRGQKQKAKDNLKVIGLVKTIEREGRAATPEEQETLAKYTGWGSVKNAFPSADGKPKDGWADVVAEVKAALTEKEYREARRSIQYAHFTSEIVVRGMWDALERFGLKGGNIFEPGMGIGNFIGMKPSSINAVYSGLEIDTMTSRIARILYPESSVRHTDFTSARYADGMFDAAIGNPPFSESIVRTDPKYRKQALSLHNYFFAKTIDMVAPGGVVAFVTSRYSMDAMDEAARKAMAEKVDLIGAIRLPNTAFKTNAHTEVVTDIIFLRKRLPNEDGNGVKWIETKPTDLLNEDGKPHHVNEYFANNPEMVLGNYAHGSMYSGSSLTVQPVENSDLKQQIEESVARLPENIITEIHKANTDAMDLTPPEKKEGAYYIKDGVLMQVDQGIGLAVPMRGKGAGGITKAEESKIKELIPIRDALRTVMAAMTDRDDKAMRSAQKVLKTKYDAFVKKHGPVTKSEMQTRAATPAQLEEERDELRNDYLAADEEFNEGDIDLTNLLGRMNPETGKKYTSAQIGRIRQQKKEEIEAAGGVVDEGDFDPASVPENVTIKYPNLDVFKADPEYYNLMILENYDYDTGTANVTDVFSKNIIAEVKKPEIKTAIDALNYSLAATNGIDLDLMSKELGATPEAIAEELEQLDMIYRTPNTKGGVQYIYAEEYLSGYVKDKLAYARALAAKDPYYKRNEIALEAVQPVDIPASNINTQLGSPYFEPKVIEDFMRQELNISATVEYIPIMNGWEVSGHDSTAPENTTQYGTNKRPATDLMASLLMRKDIRVTEKIIVDGKEKQVVNVQETAAAQDKAKVLQDKFSEWIWKSNHAESVFRKYNDEYNNIVPRQFDGQHITTAISPSITLRPHQKSAVWRIVQTGNTYLAHAVGAGKTLEMAVAAVEMRRLGQWRKPLLAVPNHMLAQFAGEFRAAYPQAKIFVADEQNFHADRRKRFVANVAKGDWDAVIMTYSSFKKVPISTDFEADMIELELDRYRIALTEAGSGKRGRGSTASRLEKQIEKMEGRLKSLRGKDKDQSFTFEELGIDALLVDEAHGFRKLNFATLQGNMKGVNPVGSKAAWDLYIKNKFLDTLHPGRSLVLASGTPLTNTLAEVFTIQRYMNERALIQRGINNFDAWSAVYAASVTNPERQPSGAYKNVTRLSEFRNLGSLSRMVREFMDTVTSDELGALVDRPTMKSGSMIIRTVKPSKEYLAFQKYLAHRTELAAKNTKKNEKGADNILAIINEGRHAAIDMRLIDPTLPEGESKLEDLIQNTYDIWKKTRPDEFKNRYRGDDRKSNSKGGAQLIFSDLGIRSRTKDGKSFSAYDHIKRKLIRLGIPAGQIAFIADYDTSEEKRRLFSMVNSGEITILIGSTAKMGTGVNVQNRLKAVHNLDAPWLPADLEQRVGRALRQGNQYSEIEVYGYGTEGSYDSTMWGMLETKAKAIIQFLKGDGDMTSMRDIEETDHFRMAKAMTSGDPRVLKQAELQSEVEKLARQASNFVSEQVKIKSGIARKKGNTEFQHDQIRNVEDALKKRNLPEEGKFLMTIMGKPYTERAEAAEALDLAIKTFTMNNTDTPPTGTKIGEYAGFDVYFFAANNSNLTIDYEIFLKHPALQRSGKEWDSTSKTFSASGTITTLTNSLNRLDRRIDEAKESIERNDREIKVLESNITDKFPKAEELKEKREQLEVIDKDLRENAPVEIVYDEYPIEYWQDNKNAINTMFSIIGDDEFSYGKKSSDLNTKEKIEKAVNKRLNDLGFSNANFMIFDAIETEGNDGAKSYSMDVAGFYNRDKDLIGISMNADDIIGTLDHEVIHKLKTMGAFTVAEWALLEKNAKAWREKYKVDEMYKDLNLTEAELNEEGIANAFQDYGLQGPVRRIANKIVRFLRAIKEVLTGKPFNFESADDVFQSIARGDVGRRAEAISQPKPATTSNNVVMYSLSENKKKALEEANEALANIKGMGDSFRPSLGKIASYILHPHQIASLYKSFSPVYLAAIDMMKTRDVIVHKLSNHMDLYNKIDRDAKKKIDAVLEIGRLSGTNYKDEAGKITVKNEDFPATVHSKKGDTIVLSGAEVDAYYGVREAMDLALDTYIQTILEEYGYAEQGIKTIANLSAALSKEQDENEAQRMQEVLKIIRDIEQAKKSGYIPFKRWGQIGVTVRVKGEKADLVYFDRIELAPGIRKKIIGQNKEVRDAVAKLIEKYPESEFTIETFEIKDFTTIKSKLNLNELDVLAASSDMTEQDYSTMRSMLEDAMKRRGFRAHFFKSNDVAGYSADFERALNDYVVSIAGHLARRSHMPKLDKKIKAIEEAGETTLFEYARSYVEYITNPKEEFAAVRQMGFLWYLAGNIASGVTNASQPFMVTAPWFKAMFTHGEIAAQMSKAYADAVAMIDPKTGLDVFNFFKAPDDVRAALKKAESEGDFIPLNTFDAMAIANINSAHLRGLDRRARQSQDVVSSTFSVPERLNRVVTYISAYRFAMQASNRKKIMQFVGRDQLGRKALEGKTGEEFAAAFADYAVFSTQFRMGKLNRPAIGRGIGTLPTQFLSFSLQAIELMYRLSKVHGGKTGTSVGIMLLCVVAMAGIRGFPFFDDIKTLFETVWKMINRTDLDIDSEMRKALADIVGPTVAEAILKGLPSALLDVDMSGRLGYGNLVPDDQGDLLGIWFDMLYTRPQQALVDTARGDYLQAMADLSPAIVRNMVQAYVWAKDGVKSGKTGDTIIPAENLTATDIGLKAIGFTSGSVSGERERIYAEQRASHAVDALRSDYYDRLARTLAQRNRLWNTDKTAAMQYQAQFDAVMAEIARYNEGAPDFKKVVITKYSLKRRVNEEMIGAAANKPRKQARGEAEELKKAFGK